MTVRPLKTPCRRRTSGGGPALHPAHPSHRLHSESLFGLLSRHSCFAAAAAEDVGVLTRRVFGVQNPLLAQVTLRPSAIPHDAETKLIGALDLSDMEELSRLTCTPYLTREEGAHHIHSPMLSKTLRYCPRCLELGFHSMFYQHHAVRDCPYHGIRLQNKCISCARPWEPLIKHIVEQPFCCPKCHWLHWRTVIPPGGAEELQAASRAISPRSQDLQTPWRVPQERVSVFALSQRLGITKERATDRRLWQRVAAWPQHPSPHWHRFREDAICIGQENWPSEGNFRTRDWRALASHPTATLRWLVQVCQAPVEQCARLLGGTWQRIQYITPLYQDYQLNAVAAALHLTLSKYGWLQINLRALEHGWQRGHPYHGVRWNGVHAASTQLCFGEASGRLIASEIRGYFVLSLLRCVGLHALHGPAEEFGQAAHSPHSYCPSWFLQREGHAGWKLRMRHRAGEWLIHRLLKRYKGWGLQRMVVSNWPTSPAIPEVARLGDLDYPQELIQFPRKIETKLDDEGIDPLSAWSAIQDTGRSPEA